MVTSHATFSLPPRALTLLSNGDLVARTSQGLLVLPAADRAAPKQFRAARGHGIAASCDPQDGAALRWFATSPRGQVLTGDGTQVAAAVPEATDVLTNDAFLVAAVGGDEYHGFAVAGSEPTEVAVLKLSLEEESDECDAERVIGTALGPAGQGGAAAFCLLTQQARTFTVRVATLSSSAFELRWQATVEFDSADRPAAWALSPTGDSVVVAQATQCFEVTELQTRPLSFPGVDHGADEDDTARPASSAAICDVCFMQSGIAAVALRKDPKRKSADPPLYTVLRVDLATGAPIELGRVSPPDVRKGCPALLAYHPAAADVAVFLCINRAVHRVELPAALAGTVEGGLVLEAKPPTLAEMLASQAAKGEVEAASPVTDAQLATYAAALKKRDIKAAAAVFGWARDGSFVTNERSGAFEHRVLPLLGKDTEAVAFYFASVRPLLLPSVVAALVAVTAPAAVSDAAALTTSVQQAAPLVDAVASLKHAPVGAPLTAVTVAVPEAAAAPLMSVLYSVLLHSVASGRLAAVALLAELIDAVAQRHTAALQAQAPGVLTRATAVLRQLGQWSRTEPGLRLGQLTAHCGPSSGAVKEAMVVPFRGNGIKTSHTSKVLHETLSF